MDISDCEDKALAVIYKISATNMTFLFAIKSIYIFCIDLNQFYIDLVINFWDKV